MAPDQTIEASCTQCCADMRFITALPHRASPHMRQVLFVCETCNRTASYMLSVKVAESYAARGLTATAG